MQNNINELLHHIRSLTNEPENLHCEAMMAMEKIRLLAKEAQDNVQKIDTILCKLGLMYKSNQHCLILKALELLRGIKKDEPRRRGFLRKEIT
jgi:hypothetical protein